MSDSRLAHILMQAVFFKLAQVNMVASCEQLPCFIGTLADCFLSGWVLTFGTVVAILLVAWPAFNTMRSMSAAGKIVFLKALVKTPKVQRLAILLFWIYSIRWLVAAVTECRLFLANGRDPSFFTALWMGAREFAPIGFIFQPVLIYLVACFIAVILRVRLKAGKKDPDLILERQVWAGTSHLLFLSAYIFGIITFATNRSGPGRMITNWLLASARDANFYDPDKVVTRSATHIAAPAISQVAAPMLPSVDTGGLFSNLSFIQPFETFITASLSLVLFLFLLEPAIKLHAFLTSFCWRVVSPLSLQNYIEGFLEALRLPGRSLDFKASHPFWINAGRTFCWLTFCYAALFLLFGFCGGPLGYGIQSWMINSAVQAGFGGASAAREWLFHPNFRIFIASIVALYGTAPLAVTALVFLPYATSRQIVLNVDGLTFLQGPFLSLWGRQFRLWSDLESLKATRKKQSKVEFSLKFRSGGKVTFNNSQVSPSDLKILLAAVDQYAVACSVDPRVFSLAQQLEAAEGQGAASDGVDDTAIKLISAQEFKSTIFIPFHPGEFLPANQIRIIKQLASKPLCAVYLARTEDGRMVIVKQFYLAEETDETRDFAKVLQREYELLSRLDHPGIAKVLNSFSVGHSTYLVIEHRPGNDLRSIVQEHGARSESLTIAWAQQLCEIMIYLHSREPAILHRDLTPDNIVAGEDRQLRLIDFGAAREFLEGITGTMIGKQCYVSPEQLRGDATRKSDVYSFGCTLYFLLTGRDPTALSQSSPAKSMACSEMLDSLVKDCTSFEEEQRPASFEEVLQRLKNLDRRFRLKMPTKKTKVVA